MKKSFWERQFTLRHIIFYLLFWGSHIAFFAFGWWKQASDTRLAVLNSLGISILASRAAGLVLAYDSALILLPLLRNVLRYLRPRLRFLAVDKNIWFHKQVSSLCEKLIFAHYINFERIEYSHLRPFTAQQLHYTQVAGITGHFMLLIMLLMFTTAHSSIRKHCFEAFWYTHHLALFFFLALYSHASGCFVRDTLEAFSPLDTRKFFSHCVGYQAWRFTIWIGIFYVGERVYREIRASRPTQITKVLWHPQEIQFTKPSLTYISGQWIYLNCPTISRFQWHPFTVTSCPGDPYISIHIRQVGDFTRELGNLMGVNDEAANENGEHGLHLAMQKGQKLPNIRIDGPYGAPAEDVGNYSISVIIGAGVGVTPWASVLRHIYSRQTTHQKVCRLQRLEFIWICKNISSFEWFQTLLLQLENKFGSDFLRIHIFFTAHLDSSTIQNIVMNDVGSTTDPLTRLASRTQFGRPDFSAIFRRISDGIINGSYLVGMEQSLRTKVGVFYCGPGAIAKKLKVECAAASSREVMFRFWKERF